MINNNNDKLKNPFKIIQDHVKLIEISREDPEIAKQMIRENKESLRLIILCCQFILDEGFDI